MEKTIRVILFKEGENWLAQGLDHDICVQATKRQDLFDLFECAVTLESREQGGLGRISAAPKYFQDLWEARDGMLEPRNPATGNFAYGLAAA